MNGDYSWYDSKNPQHTALSSKNFKKLGPFPGNNYEPKTAFRNILGDRLWATQRVNFSFGGSSNEEQIDLLKRHILNNSLLYESPTTILFGLTSPYRVFFNYQSVYLGMHDHTKSFLMHHFSEAFECDKLALELRLLAKLLENKPVKIYSFNTFIPLQLPNVSLMFGGKDILSILVDNDDEMDFSAEPDFTHIKMKQAVTLGLLDPHTFHFTVEGNKAVANLVHLEMGIN